MDFAQQLIRLIDKRIKRAFESFRPRAATLEGQIPPGSLPPGGDTGDGYTPSPHDHDDRYYTKTASDLRYAPIEHEHDHDSLPTTGGTIDGNLHVTGNISALGDITGDAISGTTLAASVGVFVAPAGSAIGGINVDGQVYGTNITTTPTAGAIPKARADGTLDPGWSVSGGGGSLPAAHASTHASGGSDPITPASIGAATPADVANAITAAQRMVSIEIASPGTAGSRTWTNQPAAVAELFGVDQHRRYIELAGYTQARIQLRQGAPGATGSTIRAQYSTDNGTNWSYLDGTAGPQVATDATTSGGAQIRAGAWATLAAGAKIGDVLIRLVGQDSDGVLDPNYGQIYLDLK